MTEEVTACPPFLRERCISLHQLWRFSQQRWLILINMPGRMWTCMGLICSREELLLLI